MTRKTPFFDYAIERHRRRPRKSIDSLIQKRSIRVAQRATAVLYTIAIDYAGHQLVQDRQRVTHRTATGANDQGKDAFLKREYISSHQSLQVGFQNIRRNQAEK